MWFALCAAFFLYSLLTFIALILKLCYNVNKSEGTIHLWKG